MAPAGDRAVWACCTRSTAECKRVQIPAAACDEVGRANRVSSGVSSRLFGGELRDLGGEDEVVAAQSTDGVGPNRNHHLAPTELDFRVVVLRFGERSHWLVNASAPRKSGKNHPRRRWPFKSSDQSSPSSRRPRRVEYATCSRRDRTLRIVGLAGSRGSGSGRNWATAGRIWQEKVHPVSSAFTPRGESGRVCGRRPRGRGGNRGFCPP